MRARKLRKVLQVGAIAIVGAGVFGFVTMSLWNELVPALFGLHTITFWQALGLLILSKILFGGFRGGGGRGNWRGRMSERWEQMTPEERAKFRHGMFGRETPAS